MKYAMLALVLAAAACGPDGDDDAACADILAGDLVISEIFADHVIAGSGTGEDAGKEWVEIYNASAAAIDLEGLTLTLSRPDGSRDNSHTISTLTVDPGGYVVLGNVAPEFVADMAWLDYGYGDALGEMFNTEGGKLTLGCGVTTIEEAQYGDVDPGQSTSFDGGGAPDYTANDDVTRWCATPEDPVYAFEQNNYGTPGAANYDCPGGSNGMCMEGGVERATVAPVPGDLVITEAMPDPDAVGDDFGEWFEVLATAEVDLNGLELGRIGAPPVDVVDAATCLRVGPGDYVVFANNGTPATNGMLPTPTGLFSFGLSNSNGDVQIGIGGVALDTYAWTTTRAGKSHQLDAAVTDATGNDDPLQWCDGASAYGAGDLGSPGAANASCGGSAATCVDPDTSTARPVVPPVVGQLTITEWMPDPTTVGDTAGEWFEVRSTVAVDLNGLQAGAATLGSTPIVPAGGTCHELAAGGYALFARTSGGNGLTPTLDGTFSFGLVQSNGTLTVGIGGVTLDSKTWTASTAARSIQIDTDGTQCVAPDGTPMYNMTATDTDFGTPKAVHTLECP